MSCRRSGAGSSRLLLLKLRNRLGKGRPSAAHLGKLEQRALQKIATL